MSEADPILAAFQAGRCPDCGGAEFRPGPRGGSGARVQIEPEAQ